MKATFTVTLVYPNSGDYHALSNMDIQVRAKDTHTHTPTHTHNSIILLCLFL